MAHACRANPLSPIPTFFVRAYLIPCRESALTYGSGVARRLLATLRMCMGLAQMRPSM